MKMSWSNEKSQQPLSAEFYPNESCNVETLTEDDICLGRGNALSEKKGNRRYRSIVKEFKNRYFEVKGHKPKDKIAKKVIKILQDQEARTFYYKNDDTKQWEKAPEEMILRKVKQALRERGEKPSISNRSNKKGKRGLSSRRDVALKDQEIKRLKTGLDAYKEEISNLKSLISRLQQQLRSPSNMPQPLSYSALDNQPQQTQFHSTGCSNHEAQANLEPMDGQQNVQRVVPIKVNSNGFDSLREQQLIHRITPSLADESSVLSSSSLVGTNEFDNIDYCPLPFNPVTASQENIDEQDILDALDFL